MTNSDDAFDEKVRSLRCAIREARVVAQAPRILSIVEDVLDIVAKQQQEIDALRKVSHYHSPNEGRYN